MFDKERFVYLNNVRLGNNGFKNLSFETSRFSDSFSSIRGFGSHLNERNLSIVDAFSLEFYIDYKELAQFAEVYAMFKALGALKLENQYIIEKIASSLSHQKAIQEVLLSYKDDLKAKEITSLIVLLERMDITSLDRTDNGYSINMVLTVLKDGFTLSQAERYTEKLNLWKEESSFTQISSEPINGFVSELKNDGGLLVEIFNVEALNAKQKEKVLLDFKTQYLKDEGDKEAIENSSTERYDAIDLFEEYKPETIKIPAVNIAQIQLITNNTISNIPISGEPIGEKAFMGIDKTGFTVKMIFDEGDRALVEKLKTLSDLSITKHKMRVTNPLVNLFDFKTGIITNIFFNNTESANGIMITMKFELSAYDYFSDNANTDTVVDLSGKAVYSSDYYMTNLYLESLCSELLSFDNKNNKRAELTKMYSAPLYREMIDSMDRLGDVGLGSTFDTKFITSYTLGDFISSYSSEITSFGGLTEESMKYGSQSTTTNTNGEGIANLIKIPIKRYLKYIKNEKASAFFSALEDGFAEGSLLEGDTMTNFDSAANEVYKDKDTNIRNMGRKDLYNGFLYRYFDLISSSLVSKTTQSLNNIRRELNPYDGMYEGEVESLKPGLTDKLFNSKYGLISKKLSENLVAEMFNGKTQNIDIRISSFMKTMYRTLIFDLFKNTENTSFLKTIKETSTYITTEGINFLLIREHVALAVKEYLNQAITIIKNKTFISDATTLVLNELTDANNLKTEGYTFKNINEYLITLTDEIANELTYNYASIERIIDKTMGYFLTKLAYSLTFLHINYAENAKSEVVSIDSIIKSHIISSSMIGLFSIKTKYRTDQLGYAYDSSAKIVSKVLNSFFYLYKKKFLKPDGEGKLIEKTEEEILEGYFSGEITKSFYKDKVKFNFMNVERKIINEQNKDYNFIFGQPIKNYGITMFLNDIFTETSELSGLNNDVERYLLTKFTQFENGEKFCDIIDPIDYGYGPTQTEKPLSYKIDNITENGKINNIMKKRLIGDCDVFNDLKKINRIVNNPVFDVMPDYEVLIKKRDLEYEGVVDSRNDFKITSAFLLKNVLRVSVMVDPKTKIKTATVTSVDSSKRILDMTRDGSIAVQVSTSKNVSTTKKDEKNGELDYNIETKDVVELFTIEAGDVIEIRLGSYKNKQFINEGFEEDFRKSIVFKGTISKISNMSNIIEISGVGNASLLYSTHHKSVVMGTEGLFAKAKNFITTVFKIGSNRGATSTGDEINQYKNNKTANNHLFNIIKNKDDFNEVFKNNERGSMYNAAHFALGSLPTIASNLITGGDLASSGLAMRKFITSQIDSPFGVVTEIEDPRSKAIDPNIYRNVYNVDKDYDTYGAQYYDMSALGNAAPKEYDENGNKIVDLEYKIKESTDKVKEEIYIANQNTAGESGSGGVGNETSTNLNENVDFIWPTKSRRITSGYQFNREHPVTKKRKDHLAIDIGRVTNSKGEFISGKNYVYASRSGVCSYGKTNNSGNYVSIDHSYSQNGKTVTCSTFYCHLESSDVYNGKKVKAGDIIGIMGGTGLSSGIHLHFAITINGTKVNPVNYLKEVE